MSDTEEVPLSGGNLTRVVRIGDTVRRIAGPWTPLVHDLEQVRARGLELAPKPLRTDDLGREVLSFIPGDTIETHPWPTWVWSDSLLVEAVHALRKYHWWSQTFVPQKLSLGWVELRSRLIRFSVTTTSRRIFGFHATPVEVIRVDGNKVETRSRRFFPTIRALFELDGPNFRLPEFLRLARPCQPSRALPANRPLLIAAASLNRRGADIE